MKKRDQRKKQGSCLEWSGGAGVLMALRGGLLHNQIVIDKSIVESVIISDFTIYYRVRK